MNVAEGWLAYRAQDVRAAEARVRQQVPDDFLMRKAAAGVTVACAEVLRERRGGIYGSRVVLLIGTGNNVAPTPPR